MITLLFLAFPVFYLSRALAHEELFADLRDGLTSAMVRTANPLARKAFYMPTCYYCAGFWCAVVVNALANWHLAGDGWRGWVLATFTLAGLSAFYNVVYKRLAATVQVGQQGRGQRAQW